MKKFILLFFFLSLIFFSSYEKIQPVISTLDIDQNNILCLKIEDLTHNNMILTLENIKILSIEPYINPLYKNQLKDLKTYYFLDYLNKNNVQKFVNHYLNELKRKGYQKDYYYYSLYGIPIQKIYIEKDELKEKLKHKMKYTIC